MTKEKFSFYNPPITSVIPDRSVSLEEVSRIIKGDTLKSKTETLRSLLGEGRTEDYKKTKTEILPAVTFGGVFDYRTSNQAKLTEKGKKGLLQTSSLVVVDIDHLSELGLDLETLRGKLSEDKEIGTRLIFGSPSGDGIKLVCKTGREVSGKEDYKEVYNRLSLFISQKYGIPIGEKGVDKSGSDITRSCLLCCDTLAISKEWDYTFSPEDHPLPEKKVKKTPVTTPVSSSTGDDGIEEIVRRVERSGIDIAPDYDSYLALGYSFSSLGERGRSYYHRVCRLSPKYKEEDTDLQFNICRDGEGNIGTFINMAQQKGININDYNNLRGGLPYTPESKTSTATRSRKKEREIEQDPETGVRLYGGKKIEDYLSIDPLSELSSQKGEGIKTGYIFKPIKEGKKKKKTENLTLRSGALTLVCGKPSHCKTKVLQNIALQIAESARDLEREGAVLFFSYEEEKSDIIAQFANIYTNIPDLSNYDTPNTDLILDYYKSGTRKDWDEGKKRSATPKLNEFREFYQSGKLRIYYSDLYSQTLCDLVRDLSKKIKIRAVFVDYVQLLYREGNRKDRREELKDICNDLRKLAIDLSIPLVLSAQLNKEAQNPTDMSSGNIADSYDLARYANTIICLWLSDMVSDIKDWTNYQNTDDYRDFLFKGFTLGESGKLYAKVTKNRGGTPMIDAVLDFTGETGYIAVNDDLPEEEETEVEGLRIL